VTDPLEALMVGRASDGRLVRRPVSPHLQIYRWQIGSVLSILHRLTGIALGLGAALLAWWLIAAAAGESAFRTVQVFLHTPFGHLLLFGWTFALYFHLANGIRHLAWDAGYGYDLPTMHRSGQAVVAAAGGLTALTWLVVLW
jgi:succinate dehydrogenase / fumarate reductase cytochrome b subunit